MASSDSGNSDNSESGIELGFIQRLEIGQQWRLHRCYFPSKIGGKPAWLNPKDVPKADDLKCSHCGKAMALLLQIYAPNDDNTDTFHRTIYIFCCKSESCYEHNSNTPFRVLRCQLSRDNEFYDRNPPDYESPEYFKSCKNFIEVCHVCGFAGNKTCSRCHKTSYCCKEHQALHWKNHKVTCGNNSSDSLAGVDDEFVAGDLLFPEYEITMETEESDSCDVLTPDDPPEVNGKFSPSELEQFANVNLVGQEFSSFRKITAASPDQVLRYDKAGSPLWCAGENKLSSGQVPKCSCGADRHFEFQVMPQLLNYLNVQNTIDGPSIDWGILLVYTCSADCQPVGQSYHLEYLHKQDFEQIQ